MKNRLLLQVMVVIFFCFCVRAVTANAASMPSVIYQVTSTATPYRSSTPVHDWIQPPGLTPTLTPNFVTQTSQAQLSQTASALITMTLTPSSTVTENLAPTVVEATITPTSVTLEPTTTRAILGESRMLIGSDRYDKSNYWAIPLGLISTLAVIAVGIVILSKRH